MKTFFLIIVISVFCTVLDAQETRDFVPAPITMYGNVLQYHYSESMWYYKELVQQSYTPNSLSSSSAMALESMLKVKPEIDYTKSILDIYRQQKPNSVFKHRF